MQMNGTGIRDNLQNPRHLRSITTSHRFPITEGRSSNPLCNTAALAVSGDLVTMGVCPAFVIGVL